MPRLFGFSIDDQQQKPPSVVAPVPKTNEDGVDNYIASGFYGQYVDIEGVYRTEYDLMKRYREMVLHPEADAAVEDVVNEAIFSDLYDSPVEIELSNLNASDKLKEKIREEFKYIKEMMDFDKKAHEIFRNWYVDGRLYYLKVIDTKKPQDGIQEVRYIDPMKMKFIRKEKKKDQNENIVSNRAVDIRQAVYPEIEEYYLYTPKPNFPTQFFSSGSPASGKGGIQIAKDSICYVTSGLFDRNKGTCLSYLHKAIKSINQLLMVEDSLVIYRLSRAPERRIFYIDVGNLPKVKAEQYLRDVMMRYRNKLVYDANTGEMRDDKKFMSMMEDFWLPRREGGRGTEITTLPGGQNLGEITDINYFQKKLYRSLNVPETRIAGSDAGFSLGRSSEILRDEVKFSKFVGRMRKRFTHLFNDILRTQLLLKNVVTPEDWDIMSDHIQYDFLYDNHFAELKDSELLQERLNLASAAEPYVGKYYSADYIRRKVLRQTDQEIIDQDKQIKQEIAKGIIPDPNAPVDPATGQPIPQTNGVLGKNTLEPEVEEEKFETSETPSGGEI